MHYEHVVTVRFNEVDRAGIAFFGRVFEYCHACFEETLAASGQPLAGHLRARWLRAPPGPRRGRLLAPDAAGRAPPVTLRVARLGAARSPSPTRCVVRRTRICGPRSGLIHAFVRLDGFAGMSVPDALRDALAGLGLLEDAADTGG
jgi:hypothetical protein